MLRSMLNLKNAVRIARVTESYDGYGATSVSTAYTTIARSSVWQAGSNDATISEKITKVSSHILALEHGVYTFTDADLEATYNRHTYKITGHADNVGERGELDVVGLQWLS